MTLSVKQVVLASGNAKKIAELQNLLSSLSIEVLTQKHFNIEDADETGLSFVENAIIKARHASQQSGLPAIADDSGLEVDALSGQPGIYSARFASEYFTSEMENNRQLKDAANNQKLLEALQGVEPEQRSARFQCVVVYMQHAADPTPIICQGSWEGVILDAPSGENGFGYDPVFYVPSHECAAAQLKSEDKVAMSHRGQAMKQLINRLEKTLSR